jgi:hypothetical protein
MQSWEVAKKEERAGLPARAADAPDNEPGARRAPHWINQNLSAMLRSSNRFIHILSKNEVTHFF